MTNNLHLHHDPPWTIQYLDWLPGRPDAATYNFASSDLAPRAPPVSLRDLGDDTSEPASERSLEALIADQYDDSITDANVFVTTGTTAANAVAVGVALATHRVNSSTAPTVVTESPGYEPLSATPRALGATIRRFQRDPTDEYAIPRATLASRLDDDTCLVSLTNRHNPSGRRVSRESLRRLAVDILPPEIPLLIDEVYAPFTTTPREGSGTAFGGSTAAGLESTIVTNSLTKFFGLEALRIGWLIGDAEFVRLAALAQRHLLSVAPNSRELARTVFHNIEEICRNQRAIIEENSSALQEFVDMRTDLEGTVRPGHTIGFLKHRTADGDAVAEAAEQQSVLLVPGRFFGDTSRFRISLGRAPEIMKEGLMEFGAVLDTL